MRGWPYLLAVVAAAASATPPAFVEIEFDLTRNGGALARVTERLERSRDEYQLTETWKGRGLYALLGSARRVSRRSLTASALRTTARAWTRRRCAFRGSLKAAPRSRLLRARPGCGECRPDRRTPRRFSSTGAARPAGARTAGPGRGTGPPGPTRRGTGSASRIG